MALDRRELAFPGRRRGDRAGPALLHRARLSPADGGWSGRTRSLSLPRLAKPALAALVAAVAVATRPILLPVLPIRDFIAYEHATGAHPSTGERLELADLPQYYADQFGWREMAEVVGKAYQELPPEDKEARRLLPRAVPRFSATRPDDGLLLRSALSVAARDQRARNLLPLGAFAERTAASFSFSAGSAKTTSNTAGASTGRPLRSSARHAIRTEPDAVALPEYQRADRAGLAAAEAFRMTNTPDDWRRHWR